MNQFKSKEKVVDNNYCTVTIDYNDTVILQLQNDKNKIQYGILDFRSILFAASLIEVEEDNVYPLEVSNFKIILFNCSLFNAL